MVDVGGDFAPVQHDAEAPEQPAAGLAESPRQDDEAAAAGSSAAPPTGSLSEKPPPPPPSLEQAPASSDPSEGAEEQLEMDAPLIGARLQIWWPLDEAWCVLFCRVLLTAPIRNIC